MALSPALLQQASRGHVVAALARVKGALPNAWLPVRHPASKGELPNNWNTIKAMDTARLAEAVAVSIPSHCIDGWSFAARAFNALLAGDMHGCRHMAYYAQLRAALCLMANLGVGLFNGINFAVDATGAIIRIDPTAKATKKGMGTHEIVWSALDEWSKDPGQSEIFLDLIRMRNTSLRDVLVTLWPGFAAAATVGKLIRVWGVDLKRGMDDRGYRNTSSYAAHALNAIPAQTATNLRFVEKTWTMFEPSGGAGFDSLDRFLLRRVLLAQHEATAPGTDPGTGPIEAQYAYLSAGIRNLCSKDFLLNKVETTQLELIRFADANSTPAPPHQMLARALLLLRTAMAFTHTSLTEAGVNTASGDLHSWLENFAEQRGFCNAAKPLGDGTGLWDDIVIAAANLKRSRTPAPADLMSWKSTALNGMPLVAEAERIAVWSLCA
jgi:hypothetical protein